MSRAITALALTFALGFGPALAQDEIPAPPEGWWRDLADAEGGLPVATYELTAGPTTMQLTVSIDSIEGNNLTYTAATTMDGNELPGLTRSVNLDENPRGVDELPEDAKVTRGESETIEALGRSFECTIFTIEMQGQTMTMWHSAELPPCFSGAAVKMESSVAGQKSVMILTGYKGKMIGSE